MLVTPRARWIFMLIAFAVASFLSAISAQSAQAAAACYPTFVNGVPTITMTKDAPSEVLFGSDVSITLRASEAASETYDGFNLSFRDVIPPGTVYKPGSSPVAPTIFANQPAAGYTTLIFSNVANLAPGSSSSLTYSITQVTSGLGALAVGAVIRTGDDPPLAVSGAGGAYVNCNPREVPRFAVTGAPIVAADSYSSSSTGIATDTLVRAIQITKTEPSPEHELLRGVHDHQTVYTLKVQNNAVNSTNMVFVDDYLPAGLEYLGCTGQADGTTAAPTNSPPNGPVNSPEEYAGSGPIGSSAPFTLPCITASVVETVSIDPDGVGPLPTGIYTHVRFDLGGSANFSPTGALSFQYATGIPICPNSLDWNAAGTGNGTSPLATGAQAKNLDNNACGLSGETVDETALTNHAIAKGQYTAPGGPPGGITQSDSTDLTVSAEDIAIQKSVSDQTLEVGAKSTWTLKVRTGEYRTYTNTVATDTLPSGYCPLDSLSNFEIVAPISPTECNATGDPADRPTVDGVPTPYSSAVENSDGTWTLVWNLGNTPRNRNLNIVFKSRTRHDYQSGFAPSTPILSGDAATNFVSLTGLNQPICSEAIGVVACPGGAQIFHTVAPNTANSDTSQASQTASFATLDKQVRAPGGATPVDCSTGASSYSAGPGTPYRPGDVVCWKLKVTFPSLASTSGITLTDFLPIGTSYAAPQPTGSGGTALNDFPGATVTDDDSFLTFNLGTPTVNDGGQTFEWIIGTVIDNAANANPLPAIRGNLLKLSTTDSLGATTALRDAADFGYLAPALTMTKGVKFVNNLPAGGLGPNQDNRPVIGNDVVTYRVDLSNNTTIPAVNTVVHERLVGPYNCSMITNISDGGSCAVSGSGVTAVTTISWDAADAITVPAGAPGTKQLNWDFTVPNTAAPFISIPDNACIDSFQNDTNVNTVFTHVPLNPVASCGAPPSTPNTTAANDTSSVVGGGTFAKSRSTSVAEVSNNASAQATIGEEITYDVAFSVPSNMTVYAGSITDPIVASTRQAFVPGSLTCSLTGSPDACGSGLLAGFSTAFNGGTNSASMTFATPYLNNSGATQVIHMTFKTKVVEIATNVAGGTLTNTATLSQSTQYATANSRSASSPSTQIVEPNLNIAKSHLPAGSVTADQQIAYSLTVTNPNVGGAIPNAAPGHETVAADAVPTGLTPSTAAGAALSDGANVVRCDGAAQTNVGTWDLTTRKITWTIGDVAPGSTSTLFYCAKVDQNSTGQATLINSVALTTTSMPGVIAGERTYTDNDTNTLTVVGAGIAKAVISPSPASATIGDDVKYLLTITIPQSVRLFDFKVIDVMPDGINNASFGAVTCVSGCSIPAATTSQSGQTLTWSFGDVASDSSARTVTLAYTTHVSAVYASLAPVASGQTLTNVARNSWRLTAGGSIVNSPNATAAVSVVEPNLAITKRVRATSPTVGSDVSTRNAQPGETYLYTVVVSNIGNSTAYDVLTDDQPPTGIINVAPVAGAAFVTDPWTLADPHMRWVIPSIPTGGSVTLTYTASLAPSAQLSDDQSLPNTAHIPESWGVPSSERLLPANSAINYRKYTADPSDSVTQTVHLPDLTIAKTVGSGAESANAELDAPFTWRVTLSNPDTVATAFDVDFSDTLPAGWVYNAGASFAPGGSIEPSIAGQVLTWNDVGNIAPGGSIVLTFTATLPSSALGGGNPTNPYTNTASGTGDDVSGASGSADGAYAAGPDSALANIQMPVLAIAKTPDLGPVTAGTASSFSILITNSGSGTARNVVVTDAFPAGLNFAGPAAASGAGVNFSTTSTTPSATNPTEIIWHFDSIPPNSTATITVPVAIPADTASGTTFTNAASVHSNERPADVTDTGSLVVGTAADVSIIKTDGGVTGTAGQNVSYTIQTTNNGPSIARNATVSDPIPAGTTFVSTTPAVGNASDTCDFNTTTVGAVTCVASASMTVGSTRSYTLVLKINPGFTGAINGAALTNVASVTATEMAGSNSATETTPVVASADIVVTKAVSSGEPSSILNHDQTEFTMTVQNKGPSDANNVTLTDDLPAGLSCVATLPSAGVGGCAGVPSEIVTYALGTITSGTTVTVKIVVRGEMVGPQLNTTTGASTTPLASAGDDTATASVTVTPMADLEITKTAPTIAQSGDDLDYAITITNHGPDPATNVTLNDQLPPGVTVSAVTPSVPACPPSVGLLVTCSFGTLAVNGTITVALKINVGFQYPNTLLQNSATTDSSTGDLDPSNNTDTADTEVGPNADVSIVKTGPAYGASQHQLVYTLAVQNHGPKTAQAVTVSDPLPAGTTFVSATATVGTCVAAAGVVSCNLGDMAINGSALIQLVVMPSGATADTRIKNTASVDSITPDPDPSNNISSVDTPIFNAAFPASSDLTLTKTVSAAAPAVGEKITFTLTSSNAGPSTATNAVVTDTLPAGLFYVTSSGVACVAAGQVVTCPLGNIEPSASVSFQIVAVVMQAGSIVNNATVNADNDREPSNNGAIAPIQAAASKASLRLTKVASKKSVLVGQTVKFKIVVKNNSNVTAVRVVVCDLVPNRLSVVRTGGGTFVAGRLCWTVPYLEPGKSKSYTVTMRASSGTKTSVTNPARVTSGNAAARRASAKIFVLSVSPRGGGTTG